MRISPISQNSTVRFKAITSNDMRDKIIEESNDIINELNKVCEKETPSTKKTTPSPQEIEKQVLHLDYKISDDILLKRNENLKGNENKNVYITDDTYIRLLNRNEKRVEEAKKLLINYGLVKVAYVKAYGDHIVYKGTVTINGKSFDINNKGDILCKLAMPFPKKKRTNPQYINIPANGTPFDNEDNNNQTFEDATSIRKKEIPKLLLKPLVNPLLYPFFIKPYKNVYKNIKHLIDKTE